MTNKRTTKQALVASVLLLCLSFSMLLGTTFAWFTDSATSAGNKIVAGTLDVQLWMYDESVSGYVDISDSNAPVIGDGDALFGVGDTANENSTATLWEPGKTQVVYLKIVNAGSLDLKYQVAINVRDTDGEQNLYEVLKYDIVENAKDGAGVDKWEGGKSVKVGNNIDTTDVKLPAKKDGSTDHEHYFALAVHMDEDAGNKYQGGSVEFDIKVLATQEASEKDSFGPSYDEDAIYYDALATTDAELKAAIIDLECKVIAVKGDLSYDWGGKSYAESAALYMKGKTIVGFDNDSSITFAGYGSANPITDVTLNNITVKDNTVGDNENSWEHGHLEFVNLNAQNVVFADIIMLDGNSTLVNCSMINNTASWYGIWIEGGNTVIDNCKFSGTRSIKIHEAYGSDVESVVINNCVIGALSEKPGVVIGDVNADTTVTISKSKFINCQPGDQVKYIYESDTKVDTFNFVIDSNKLASEVTVSSADDLTKALKSEATSISVELAQDIELNERLNITDGKEVYLDMNGKTITVESGSSADPAFYTYKNSTLVIDGNGTIVLEDPSLSLLFPGGDVIIENGNFIRKVPAGTPANKVGALIVGAKVSPWGSQTVTINGGYFDGGYYDSNAADVDEILAGTKELTETEADKANRGKSTDKNAIRVAIKNNTQLTLNLSYNLFKIYGGTFVGVNPAWGDEGCMLPATNELYLRPWSYYQGALLDGQEYNENGIVLPDGYTITKDATEDGRPTYTVEYNK